METQTKSTAPLFEVYLRLRPPPQNQSQSSTLSVPERFLAVETPATPDRDENSSDETDTLPPTHITLNPPNDNRRRAVEKFAFTQVFEEHASQLDLFQGTGVISLVEGVLGSQGNEGRDGLLATLGVTGSGKSHTILGTKSQRGLTQLALDLLFRSIADNILDPASTASLHATVAASDPSEAQVLSAQGFFDILYGDPSAQSRGTSRAATPLRGESIPPTPQRRNHPNNSLLAQTFQRPSVLPPSVNPPQTPDISSLTVPSDPTAEYAILISMYEVYNDRIFDLLTPGSRTASTKDFRRRPLLFKSTEASPDRKVVAGLRKVICANLREALMVLEAGLHERRVAGTGINSVSSRSHGFFSVEVKKRRKGRGMTTTARWGGSALTIVDLAGSERARDAKTQGATLAEAGKINESLMYLGQCLQMQSDAGGSTKPNLVPFRQCKLTELLFSNSFPSSSGTSSTSSSTSSATSSHHSHRNPQKAIMIVTADPLGDFNATSQILRYSALAREITVPRIPSISSTILAASVSSAGSGSGVASNTAPILPPGYQHQHQHQFPQSHKLFGRMSPTLNPTERQTMELAALTLASLTEEVETLRSELAVSEQSRLESEAHLLSAQERLLELESEIREECYAEMEERIEREVRRWKVSWEEERERVGGWVDKKVGVVVMGLGADADDQGGDENKENVDVNGGGLEEENERLRMEVKQLRREVQNLGSGGAGAGSPTKKGKNQSQKTKKSVLGEVSGFGASALEDGLGRLRLDSLAPEADADADATAASIAILPDDSALLPDNNIDTSMNTRMTRSLRSSAISAVSAQSNETSTLSTGSNASASTITSKSQSPTKKVRKFTARKWDLMGEEEMERLGY